MIDIEPIREGFLVTVTCPFPPVLGYEPWALVQGKQHCATVDDVNAHVAKVLQAWMESQQLPPRTKVSRLYAGSAQQWSPA